MSKPSDSFEMFIADPERHCFVMVAGSMSTDCRACCKPLIMHNLYPDRQPHDAMLEYLDKRDAQRKAEGRQ